MSGYAFHPEAFTDLDQLWEYIAEHKVDAADRVVGDIFAALRRLVASPHIGHRRPDLTARPLRFHRVRDYATLRAPNQGGLTSNSVCRALGNIDCVVTDILRRHPHRGVSEDDAGPVRLSLT